jgi:integrase
MRLLDPLDVDLLSRALPDRYAGLPIVAAYTGMRWGELAGLRVADINLLRRRLTIRSSLVEAAGQLPQQGTTKSAATERTISLPRVVVDRIASHLNKYPPIDGDIWTTEKGEFLRRGSFSPVAFTIYDIPMQPG